MCDANDEPLVVWGRAVLVDAVVVTVLAVLGVFTRVDVDVVLSRIGSTLGTAETWLPLTLACVVVLLAAVVWVLLEELLGEENSPRKLLRPVGVEMLTVLDERILPPPPPTPPPPPLPPPPPPPPMSSFVGDCSGATANCIADWDPLMDVVWRERRGCWESFRVR